MNFKNIKTIWKKEIKDTVRDRRTMLSMVLIPMLLMPVILIGMVKFIESQEKTQEEQVVKVAILGGENAQQIAKAVEEQEKTEIIQITGDVESAVAKEEIDAAIVIPQDFSTKIENQEPVQIEFINKSTNINAANVYAMISAAVSDFNSVMLQQRFDKQGINPNILSDVKIVPKDVATDKETSGFILGLIIPLFIVIYAIVGGQYTAIDVSAGEKERKTLEALLLTPAKRVEIVMGKFLAVSTVALTSIVIAIGSLYLSFKFAGDMGGAMQTNMGASSAASAASFPDLNFSVEPQAAILLFAVSIFLVLMFSAIILSISIFAKSFKEAESYIGPAYMLVVLPIVFINSAPAFEPGLGHFAIPAVNAVLLFKEILMGTYDTGHILLTFVSLIIFSAVAILIATKIYSKEKVLFND